ncbi:MAG TPA: hypothetical protein VFQ65_17230 [Kofleriaceae bacterium]|nr:hypothetical protein [Kofleriaceae bacterium]
MRAWRVLLTSVVVHAVAIAIWVWCWDRTQLATIVPPVPAASSISVELVPPPQILEVAFVDDTAVAAATPVSPRPSTSTSRSHASGDRAMIATSTGATSSAAGPERGGTSAGTHHGLGMRGPELHPSDEAMGHIAEQPGHVGTTPIPSHRLDDAPNGREVIHDAVTEIVVDRDGTAHLHDKKDVDAHVDINPLAWRKNLVDVGHVIAAWAENPEADKEYGSTQDLPEHLQALPDQCATWGDPNCTDENASTSEKSARKRGVGQGLALFSMSGKLDITSYLMKKLGVGDAYSARKLKALDDTRLERAEKGAAFKAEQLAHAAQLMQANLERVWAGTHDPDERKAVLFELWDECAEGEGPTGVAGDRARAMVMGWIRAQLPAGSSAAFTPAELALLDRRRTSRQHFAPYEP